MHARAYAASVIDNEAVDGRLTIALERSWKSVDGQRERLDKFHDRAVGLLGAASVMVGVGAAVNSKVHPDLNSGWSRLGLASFACAVFAAVYILMPRQWRFDSVPSSFQWYFEHSTLEQLRSSLLADAQRDYQANGTKLLRLGWAVTAETVLLGVAAVGLLLAYAGG